MKRILTTLKEKWPEYLLEILVLIIGIYGAFAVDNWREYRNTKSEEQLLYNQLILDYEANLEQLNQKIELHQSVVKSQFYILDAIDTQESNIDSLLEHLSKCMIDVTYDPITNNLGGSGKINLIKEPELNRLLSNWSSDLQALREMEIMWQGRVFTQLLDVMIELGINRDAESTFWNLKGIHTEWLLGKSIVEVRPIKLSKTRHKVEDILESKKLEGIIANGIIMNQGAVFQSLAIKAKIERTLTLLHQELNK